jgi:hypothetical protein
MQTINSIKNKKLKFSNHALTRMNQRGIKDKTITIFQDYGHLTHVRNGAVVLSLDKREKFYIRSDLDKQTYKKYEKQLNSYFVISNEGTVITAARSYKKVRRH